MKNTIVITSICTLLCFACLLSCKKNTSNPPNPNEEELITTVQLHFSDSASIQPDVTVTYRDLDGDGGQAPSQWDSILLKPNTTYNMEIILLDESGTLADTISQEVWDERLDHLFCFSLQQVNCQVQRIDSDGTYEVGLLSRWKTTNASSGQAEIILKHQPGIKNGSCTPGATDLDVTFGMRIQ